MDIELSWMTSHMYIFINNALYATNQVDIFKCYKEYNGYHPKLNLSNYNSVEDYIDDALVNFPSKAHLTNYRIKNQADGKKYTKRTEEDIDYYEVLIEDLDDDVEWKMIFSGNLKDNESPLEGDLNGNGKIDLKDIILLIKKYLGII